MAPVARGLEHVLHRRDLGRVPAADVLVEIFGLEI